MRRILNRGVGVSLLMLALGACGRSAPTASLAAAGGDHPGGDTAGIDLRCDDAAYPSAQWTSCEAQNYAKILEAPVEEAANPAFVTRWIEQSAANQFDYTARDLDDPSWLLASSPLLTALLNTPPSELAQTLQDRIAAIQADPTAAISLPLNAPLVPLCSTWSLQCTGDPYRYPQVAGADGRFYTEEAEVVPIVFYDDGCARLSGHVWLPKNAPADARLPTIVIDNGSIQAPETLYWWAAQLLVRNGYMVMTYDPRGQGRSDWQTPSGGQGGNIDTSVFVTGLVNAIDFLHSTPSQPYPENQTCAGRYPTAVTGYNPYFDRIDRDRLGVAGHSAGAFGASIVQGLGADGAAPWFGKLDAHNPVKVIVAWDALAVGDPGAPLSEGYAAVPRVPALSLMSEYVSPAGSSATSIATTAAPYLTPPDPDDHLLAYQAFADAGVPVFAITIAGATHFDFSLLPTFPASSWCPQLVNGACSGGWGLPLIEHYTLAWFDRWLKKPGEAGYADADARLLDDDGPQGRLKMSWHFHSARDYPARGGREERCNNLRRGCTAS
ncbi:hypothetical protein [Solimonas terrae]|uniref:Alpha/beta hydrolase n=1 Tax=Solimonas terrae TaxID=1396819 RepID=A0A6M2BRG1_9GAMM|nr:hypothetical protein [Solimonas terrae]NGY04801.1 hypothetical protein [Solimonas terrae]